MPCCATDSTKRELITHNEPAGIIHLWRNPIDNLVSRFHHESRSANNDKAAFQKFLHTTTIQTFLDRYATWHANLLRTLAEHDIPSMEIDYESYSIDAEATIKRVSDFLHIPADLFDFSRASAFTSSRHLELFTAEQLQLIEESAAMTLYKARGSSPQAAVAADLTRTHRVHTNIVLHEQMPVEGSFERRKLTENVTTCIVYGSMPYFASSYVVEEGDTVDLRCEEGRGLQTATVNCSGPSYVIHASNHILCSGHDIEVCDTKFGINFCDDWCDDDEWHCGFATIMAEDPRNSDNVDYDCDCTGCGSCTSSLDPVDVTVATVTMACNDTSTTEEITAMVDIVCDKISEDTLELRAFFECDVPLEARRRLLEDTSYEVHVNTTQSIAATFASVNSATFEAISAAVTDALPSGCSAIDARHYVAPTAEPTSDDETDEPTSDDETDEPTVVEFSASPVATAMSMVPFALSMAMLM